MGGGASESVSSSKSLGGPADGPPGGGRSSTSAWEKGWTSSTRGPADEDARGSPRDTGGSTGRTGKTSTEGSARLLKRPLGPSSSSPMAARAASLHWCCVVASQRRGSMSGGTPIGTACEGAAREGGRGAGGQQAEGRAPGAGSASESQAVGAEGLEGAAGSEARSPAEWAVSVLARVGRGTACRAHCLIQRAVQHEAKGPRRGRRTAAQESGIQGSCLSSLIELKPLRIQRARHRPRRSRIHIHVLCAQYRPASVPGPRAAIELRARVLEAERHGNTELTGRAVLAIIEPSLIFKAGPAPRVGGSFPGHHRLGQRQPGAPAGSLAAAVGLTCHRHPSRTTSSGLYAAMGQALGRGAVTSARWPGLAGCDSRCTPARQGHSRQKHGRRSTLS